MKGDFSRRTFAAEKHYSGVRMQQGRVQVDADWNEQAEIARHRVQTETRNTIGLCGGPIHDAAFRFLADAGGLPGEEQAWLAARGLLPLSAGDFLLGSGRYYVGGRLCEAEHPVPFTEQPDLPTAALPTAAGPYLLYLDVWSRHITALDDASIRETALGGPDTATRLKNVWQARLFPLQDDAARNCLLAFAALRQALTPPGGTLRARTRPVDAVEGPCIIPPSAGYRGLENQLYRVEIHDGGASLDVSTTTGVRRITAIPSPTQVVYNTGTWTVGQRVEVFSGKAGADPMAGTLATVLAHDSASKILTLNTDAGLSLADDPRIRPVVATYKWSRDNGSVATAILKIDGRDLTVQDVGRDAVLGFAPGQWVELTDDRLDLDALPGELAQIESVDPARRTVRLRTAPTPLSGLSGGVDPELHPKLRRWDGVGAVRVRESGSEVGWVDLEDGLQVRFAKSSYATGDFWQIPARSVTLDGAGGAIEWPAEPGGDPAALRPAGIHHRYCPLALLQWDGAKFTLISDCRTLFPPATELKSLFYVSGDGQEVLAPAASDLAVLPQPLVVGVANGRWPVEGARVRFRVLSGGGALVPAASPPPAPAADVVVVTGADGLARCTWQLGSSPDSQQVEATLLDANDAPVHLPVIFTANLEKADEGGGCDITVGTGGQFPTLQEAIDKLLDPDKPVSLCLCLLSGDHKEPGLRIRGNRRQHVQISGCGRGTRLFLERPIEVGGLASFALRSLDAAARFDAPLVRLREVADARLENVGLTFAGSGADLFVAEAVDHLAVVECQIVNVFFWNQIADLAQVGIKPLDLEEDHRRVPERVREMAATLLAATPDARKAFVEIMRGFLGQSQVPPDARNRMLSALPEVLQVSNTDPAASTRLNDALARIFFHGAVIVGSGNERLEVRDSLLAGALRLYGIAPRVEEPKLDELMRLVKEKKTLLGRAVGDLHLHDNDLTCVELSAQLLDGIQNNTVNNYYRALHLSGSTWESPNSQLLGGQVTFTGNYFGAVSGPVMARVIGRQLAATGNSAESRDFSIRHSLTNTGAVVGANPPLNLLSIVAV